MPAITLSRFPQIIRLQLERHAIQGRVKLVCTRPSGQSGRSISSPLDEMLI